jgi:outer membrane protein
MKKLSPVLNVVLLIAVAVLYVLHFTAPKNELSGKQGQDTLSMNRAGKLSIAYINIDSVMLHYKMYDDIAGDLQDKVKASEAKFQSQQRTFQKNVDDFQYKVQRGLVTRSEAEELQKKLATEEQSLAALQNQLQYQLAEEQQVAQRKVLNAIMEYLKTMPGSEKYQYILSNSFGGSILYANEGLNVTNQVIDGLNGAYKPTTEKEKK